MCTDRATEKIDAPKAMIEAFFQVKLKHFHFAEHNKRGARQLIIKWGRELARGH